MATPTHQSILDTLDEYGISAAAKQNPDAVLVSIPYVCTWPKRQKALQEIAEALGERGYSCRLVAEFVRVEAGP